MSLKSNLNSKTTSLILNTLQYIENTIFKLLLNFNKFVLRYLDTHKYCYKLSKMSSFLITGEISVEYNRFILNWFDDAKFFISDFFKKECLIENYYIVLIQLLVDKRNIRYV